MFSSQSGNTIRGGMRGGTFRGRPSRPVRSERGGDTVSEYNGRGGDGHKGELPQDTIIWAKQMSETYHTSVDSDHPGV